MKEQATKSSKYHGLIAAFLVLMAIGLLSFTNMDDDSHTGDGSEHVMTIDGEAVSRREFDMYLSKNTGDIYHHFYQAYGVEDGEGFWQGSYGGERPLAMLKEKALKELLKVKIEQIMAKEEGLTKDVGYEAFLLKYSAENERRKKAVANNEVIYGPVQYEEAQYYFYLHSYMLSDLKDIFQKEGRRVTEAEIADFYEKEKENRFRIQDKVTLEAVTVRWEDVAYKEAARKEAEKVLAALKKGGSWEVAMAPGESAIGTERIAETILINEDVYKQYGMSRPTLMEAIDGMQEQAISQIIDEGTGFTIFTPTKIEAMGYRPLDAVAVQIKNELSEEKFDTLVAKRMEEATVVIEQALFDQITVR